MHPRPVRRLLAVAAAGAAIGAPSLAAHPAPAPHAERVEVRQAGTCGGASAIRLRARAEDGRIRIDTRVRTARAGTWRLTVLHERRSVARVRVRATRAAGGFSHRVAVPDWTGADAVAARAVSPAGETCTVDATVAGS